jgi:hypothetical protein
MIEKILTISIPTYNRSEILRDNLLKILDVCQIHGIDINIYDESNNNDTQKIIDQLTINYDILHYYKNPKKLGYGKNFINALTSPKTDYVWLLGDSQCINYNFLDSILTILRQKKFGIIAVNSDGIELSQKSKSYHDRNEVLEKFGSYMTLAGATIYSKKCISMIYDYDFSNTINFPQILVSFKYLATECSFYWINNKVLSPHKMKISSYWNKDIFKVFLIDWTNTIMSLSQSYDQNICKKIIIEHSNQLFDFITFLNLRRRGMYNYRDYKRYSGDLKMHSKVNKYFLIMITFIPIIVLNKLYKIYQLSR